MCTEIAQFLRVGLSSNGLSSEHRSKSTALGSLKRLMSQSSSLASRSCRSWNTLSLLSPLLAMSSNSAKYAIMRHYAQGFLSCSYVVALISLIANTLVLVMSQNRIFFLHATSFSFTHPHTSPQTYGFTLSSLLALLSFRIKV